MYVSWIEINKHALLNNIKVHKEYFAPLDVAFVIKGNGYGHDMQLIAQVCQASDEVKWLCVASLSEAILVRSWGITKSLLVLSIIDAPFEKAIIHDIDVVVHSYEQLKMLENLSNKFKKPLRIHIKIDTGLSRLGWSYDHIEKVIEKIMKMPMVVISGVFTHLSDRNNVHLVKEQLDSFAQIINTFERFGHDNSMRHITGTELVKNTNGLCTMVRIGLGLYGIPYDEQSKALPLQLAMTWKASIIQVKNLRAGTFVSYGSHKQVNRLTTIAVIPVGYCDGYPLSLSNKGYVIIRDQLAPILGRVTMNLIIVDVTDIKGVVVGDQAFIIADKAHIHPNDLATKAQTITYEIITGIAGHIPRVLI